MYNFYIFFENFCNFFQNSLTPGGPWGGARGPGGAPPRGYPRWVPLRNNFDVLRFWNILESVFRHNKQKKRDRSGLGDPPGPCTPPKHPPNQPGGPPKVLSVPFFGLLCLNNYSKIFQKRRNFKLFLGGTRLGYPLGGPPRGPWVPPRGPRVSESFGKNCKNSQTIYKKFTFIKIPQI